MQLRENCGKMLTTEGGYLVCPICKRNRRVKRISADEQAKNLILYCRDCKTEFRVDIVRGQCFESRSQ